MHSPGTGIRKEVLDWTFSEPETESKIWDQEPLSYKLLFLLQLKRIGRAQTPNVPTPTLTPINTAGSKTATLVQLEAALTGTFNSINESIVRIRMAIEQLRAKFNKICAIC